MNKARLMGVNLILHALFSMYSRIIKYYLTSITDERRPIRAQEVVEHASKARPDRTDLDRFDSGKAKLSTYKMMNFSSYVNDLFVPISIG